MLVASECAGSACSYLELAFLRLTRGSPPAIETAREFWYADTDLENDTERLTRGRLRLPGRVDLVSARADRPRRVVHQADG